MKLSGREGQYQLLGFHRPSSVDGTIARANSDCSGYLEGLGEGSRLGFRRRWFRGGRGSDVESGLAFAPALRTHQCTQRRNGANHGQQNKTGNKKKSAFHIVYRERYHNSPPMVQLYHFNQFASRNHNAMILRAIFFVGERSIEDRGASIHER